jgi:hypothetical protein
MKPRGKVRFQRSRGELADDRTRTYHKSPNTEHQANPDPKNKDSALGVVTALCRITHRSRIRRVSDLAHSAFSLYDVHNGRAIQQPTGMPMLRYWQAYMSSMDGSEVQPTLKVRLSIFASLIDISVIAGGVQTVYLWLKTGERHGHQVLLPSSMLRWVVQAASERVGEKHATSLVAFTKTHEDLEPQYGSAGWEERSSDDQVPRVVLLDDDVLLRQDVHGIDGEKSRVRVSGCIIGNLAPQSKTIRNRGMIASSE